MSDLNLDLSARASDRERDPSLGPARPRADRRGTVWAIIATLLLAAALWVGLTMSHRGAESAHPAEVPTMATAIATAVAAVVSHGAATAIPAVVPTAVTASVGSSADAQPTPTDDQKAAWYLQQETTEQDYCQCSGR